MVREMSGASKKHNGFGARLKLPERVALTWITVTGFRESLSRLAVVSCSAFGHSFFPKMVSALTKGDALRILKGAGSD
jgi:hypothetical protein